MSVAEQSVITRASREWWKRPDDERYLTLDDLYRAILARAEESRVSTIPNQSLLARGSGDPGGELYLVNEDLGTLDPTHWSLASSRPSPGHRPNGFGRSRPCLRVLPSPPMR